MQRYPKRLIEVDLPIKRISAHARREKSIRHGHISTLQSGGHGALSPRVAL
jgi:putative DNA methylase